MTDTEPRPMLPPLGRLAMFLLPILLLVRRGERRLMLERRAMVTRKLRGLKQARKLVKRELDRETDEFWQIIESSFVRMGHVYLPRHDHQSAAGARKGKAQKVRVEQAFASLDSPEVIYYKLATRRRGRFATKNALPYNTFVGDLVSEDRLRELSWACQRVVTAVYEDPRFGVWLLVHRLEGVGGLPTNVRFRQMLNKYPEDMSMGHLVLGMGEHRSTHSVTIEDHPHILIAGSTRCGKSNILNNLISSLMIFTDPKDLKFILIDLKRMEFKLYRKSGHLYCPIVTEAELAVQTLEHLADEIHARSTEIEPSECKSLTEWNAEYPDRAFPRLICVIDEHAELMLASGTKTAKKVSALVDRISNLGRAVGVHLWICTQHPHVKVLGNSSKTNFPCIIAGHTQNKIQSAVILGNGDAAMLPLVPGRMIYQSGPDQNAIQTPYIDKEDIRFAVQVSRGRATGLITIQGTDPVILYEGLIKFVAENGGKLSANLVQELLADYAITPKMYKAFVAELIRAGRVQACGNIYSVVQKGKTYYLVVEAQPVEEDVVIEPAEPEPTPFTFEVQPHYLRLVAPAPAPALDLDEVPLMIELPAITVPEPARPAKTSRSNGHELGMMLDQFIVERCSVEPDASIGMPQLYRAYKQYCREMKTIAASLPRLGRMLAERRFYWESLGPDGKGLWMGIGLRKKRRRKPKPTSDGPDDPERPEVSEAA